MIRYLKTVLVISCLIALGVIFYRYANVENYAYWPPRTKIYSFSLDKNSVTIKSDRNQIDSVEWGSNDQDNGAIGQDDTIHQVADKKDITTRRKFLVTVRRNKITTEIPTTYRMTEKLTTVKATTRKTTEKVVTLPPLTKSPSTKSIALVTTSKSTSGMEPVVTVRSGEIPFCSPEGEKLVGALAVDQSVPETENNIEDTWHDKGWVEKGGAWRPTKCQAVSKVAIVLPYRKREEQLKIFLRHMHPMLRRQLLDYRIMVIEQAGETNFNRAMLFNIGFKEALKFQDFKCFVFHDVDLMPENDKNYYGCPTAPRHLSVAIDKFQYRLPYATIFGGAGAFRKEDFETINGFSNQFWGWGGEDDDLYRRINAKGFKLTRPSMNVGRYKMVRIFHQSAKRDGQRFEKLKSSVQRMPTDGLNSLKYTVLKTDERPLYTKVTVEVNPRDV